MRVQWRDAATGETRRMVNIDSIEEEGATIVITNRDRTEQETVPLETDLFVWGGEGDA